MVLFFISFISKKRERSFIYFHQRLSKSTAICNTKIISSTSASQTSVSFFFFFVFFFALKAF